MLKKFKIGGIHPCDNKISADAVLKEFPLPKNVIIPLSQHIGAPAAACVAKGDKVVVGQLIGTATGFVSANIHSSVSGTVTAVDTVPDGLGVRKPSITIAVEGDEWLETIDRSNTLVKECNLSAQEIIKKIADAGIVGMGGATFPTQVKLSIPEGKNADYLIINGVECEPYLTSDYRLMLEHGEELLIGVSIIAKSIGAKKSFIGIENNKPKAIQHLSNLAKEYGIEIIPLRVQYPQGGEKQLIDAVVSRQVPSGKLPIDVGAVVQNVGTALAVYHAVQKNRPLIDRIVTVTGKSLAKPSNYIVRIGTPIRELVDACGGLGENTGKVINGGPMMGRGVANLDATITKGSSGILLMDCKESSRSKESCCISCAKCIDVCPMGLEPYIIARLSKLGRLADTEEYNPQDCIECGSCSYTCPASIPLLDYIRMAKGEVMKIMRSRK